MNEHMIFTTDRIPIIDTDGSKIDEVQLKERIRPVPRRRCGISEKGIFYKGAGIIYTGHFVNEYDSRVKLVAETGGEYEKYHVVYPSLYRRYGIFNFPHQPVFSDLEGGCGKKEKNLIVMQQKFEYSAIEEITDIIDIPLKDHGIYGYRLKEVQGSYKDTIRLIEYLLCENYNTAWDKNVWDDIACFRYVRDLADWFISKEFRHKLGTVYAFLNDLNKKDKYLYELIVRELTDLEQLGSHHIIYIAALIVRKFSPESVPNLDLKKPGEELYSLLWNELYSGKACCHLEEDEAWDFIRAMMKEKIPANVSLAMKDLYYHKIMSLRR